MLVTMSNFLTHFFHLKKYFLDSSSLPLDAHLNCFWLKSDAQPGEFEENVIRQCRQSLISNPDDQGISETLSRVFKLSEDAVGQCLMATRLFFGEKP